MYHIITLNQIGGPFAYQVREGTDGGRDFTAVPESFYSPL